MYVTCATFSHRLNKLEFLLLLHFLYLENILEGRVIKELPLLVNLCVGLGMDKQTRVSVIPKTGVKLRGACVDRESTLTAQHLETVCVLRGVLSGGNGAQTNGFILRQTHSQP